MEKHVLHVSIIGGGIGGLAKENLLRLFAGWREPIEQLIAATDE